VQRASSIVWIVIIAACIGLAIVLAVSLVRVPATPPAPEEPPMSEEDLRKLAADPACIDAGRKIFGDLCKTCHGPNGEGLQGPNLRDDYWLHGPSMSALVKTISEGNPAKGMASWKYVYKPAEIRALAAFVASLKGATGGPDKAPEGLYEPIGYH
jgi:mono/diheme cytochrome c family protein